MIFKRQRPLASREPNPPALAHDQRRTLRVFVPTPDGLTARFGSKDKIFVEAYGVGKELEIARIVPDRGW